VKCVEEVLPRSNRLNAKAEKKSSCRFGQADVTITQMIISNEKKQMKHNTTITAKINHLLLRVSGRRASCPEINGNQNT
jgi:hypothetical protein